MAEALNLISLCADENHTTHEGVKYLGEAFKHDNVDNCKLSILDVSANLIGHEGAKHFAEALKHDNCKLKTVYNRRACNTLG